MVSLTQVEQTDEGLFGLIARLAGGVTRRRSQISKPSRALAEVVVPSISKLATDIAAFADYASEPKNQQVVCFRNEKIVGSSTKTTPEHVNPPPRAGTLSSPSLAQIMLKEENERVQAVESLRNVLLEADKARHAARCGLATLQTAGAATSRAGYLVTLKQLIGGKPRDRKLRACSNHARTRLLRRVQKRGASEGE